jgi:alpha-mannosidase
MQNRTLHDVFNLQNGGDAGSVEQYAIPTPDVVVQAGMAERSEVEVSQVYERLVLQHRMRIAPGLNEGRRERGVRLLEIKTTITAYKDVPGLAFRVSFTNIANDHRLRAHLRTGLRPDHLLVDAPFGAIRRMFPPTGTIGLQPMHSAAGVAGSTAMLGLFTRGLHEIEPIKVDGQLTLALTLLRATGWMDGDHTQAIPGAQHNHEINAEFMMVPLTASDPAGFLHTAQLYQAPLQAYAYGEAPAVKQRSYLTLSDPRVLLTALKPPQSGRGLVVRLLNPTYAPIDVSLTPLAKLAQAWRISLAEVAHGELPVQDGKVNLTIDPHQIVTLRLQFDDA